MGISTTPLAIDLTEVHPPLPQGRSMNQRTREQGYPPVDRQTDTYENITSRRTSYARGKIMKPFMGFMNFYDTYCARRHTFKWKILNHKFEILTSF